MFKFLCLFLIASIYGFASDEIRILKLLPNLENPLAVDPSIPIDYEVSSLSGNQADLHQGVLWAKKSDIAQILQNPSAVNHTFIIASMSKNITQIEPDAFSGEDIYASELEKAGFKEVKISKSSWGSYPVLSMEAINKEGRKTYAAWVGLNSVPTDKYPGEGLVLVFNFFYPSNEMEPTKDEIAIWENFLSKTKQLPDHLFLKAYGLDLQDDFTIFTHNESSVKVMAQKRTLDNKLAVIIQPLTPNTSFEIKEVSQIILNGLPAVKVDGAVVYITPEVTDFISVVIDAYLKEGSEFTKDFQSLIGHDEVTTYQSF